MTARVVVMRAPAWQLRRRPERRAMARLRKEKRWTTRLCLRTTSTKPRSSKWRCVRRARPFPSRNRSILTEIYLCHACSCQEILRTETAGQALGVPEELLEEASLSSGAGGVGHPLVGHCLTTVFAEPEWSSMMWIKLELKAATAAWREQDTTLQATPPAEGGTMLQALPRLLETLAKMTGRLRLVAVMPARLRFIKTVHLALLGAAHSRLEVQQQAWAQPQSSFTRSSSAALEAGCMLHGCALHNTAAFCSRTLAAWGESLFYLTLQPAASPSSDDESGGIFANWVDSFQHLSKQMLTQLADQLCAELQGPLQEFRGACESLYSIDKVDHFSAAMVSDELRPLLSKLDTMLGQCESSLHCRSWPVLWRSAARQLDRAICSGVFGDGGPPGCTEAGVSLLAQDVRAVYAAFGEGGRRYFKRTEEALCALQLQLGAQTGEG
jgi:hypothetical protein